jgi:ribonuclease HI
MDDTLDNPHVQMFTDGACHINPGPGGWAHIIRHPASGKETEAFGGEHNTTNNRMEMMAVIRGLESLTSPSRVDLLSDSTYVVKGIREWMDNWKTNGWRKRRNGPAIKNMDLWKRMHELCQTHDVNAKWVKGHRGHPENERCDQLAEAESKRIAQTPAPSPPEQTDDASQGSLFG